MKNLSSHKSLFLLGFILLASFLLVSILNYTTARRSIYQEVTTQTLPLLRENIYSEIHKDLVPALNVASMMSRDSFLIDWALKGEQDLNGILRYLEKIHRDYQYFTTFFVSAKTSNYYHFTGISKQISPENDHDRWYYDFIESGAPYILDVDSNEAADGALTIFINYRIEDYQGNLLGVTGAGIKMQEFSQYLRETQEKYHRHIYLVDQEGIIQAHSQEKHILSRSLYDQTGMIDASKTLLSPKQEPVDAVLGPKRSRTLISSRYMEELQWYLVVEQNEKEVLAPARRNLLRTLIIGFSVSLVIIVITYFFIRHVNRNLEQLATTDPLTMAGNRRDFDAQLPRKIYRRERYGTSLSLIIMDLDDFKMINDSQGHQEGDKVLERFCRLVQATIRPDDLLFRWGGDEFALLLESSLEETVRISERILERVKESENEPDHIPGVSMGATQFREGDSAEELIRRADRALYNAKETGKGRLSFLADPV